MWGSRQGSLASTFTIGRYPPGPSIIPVTSSMLSSFVTTRIPSGGFVLSSLSSFISRRNTAGVTDYFQPNRTSEHRASAIEHFDATYHDGEAESRRRGGVEAEERGLRPSRKFTVNLNLTTRSDRSVCLAPVIRLTSDLQPPDEIQKTRVTLV